MKKRFLAALATGLLVVGMGGVAQAFLISGDIDVGSLDPLKSEANLGNSSIAEEENWVQSELASLGVANADSYFISYKNEGLALSDWFNVIGDESIFAFELSYTPQYFLVKTGGGNGPIFPSDGNTHFLFENLADFNWAVIKLADMGFNANNGGVWDIEVVSHISEFNGAPVPEPATMLLFGAGLAGLAGVARRKKKA